MTNELRAIEIAGLTFPILADDSKVIESPDWRQIVTPSTKALGLNLVLKAGAPDHELPKKKLPQNQLPQDRLKFRIEKALDEYRKHDNGCWWLVAPWSSPDLEVSLLQAGLTKAYDALGLVIETGVDYPTSSPDIQIEPLSPTNVEEYVWASFENRPGAEQRIEYFKSQLRRNDPDLFFLLARVNGKAAGTGTLRITSGIGNLNGGVVHSKFQKQGVYKALLGHRLNILRSRGVKLAATLAMADTSAPICLSLGFRKVCTMTMYRWNGDQPVSPGPHQATR